MFSEITIKEPLEKVVDDWDLLNDRILSHFSTFRASGHNVFGIRRRIISDKGIDDPKKGNISQHLELGPNGIEHATQGPLNLRITTAGTPHRVSHNFGYWHINDKDELYLPVPGVAPDVPGYYLIVMGLPKENETDAFAWYCRDCTTLLFDFVVETGNKGFEQFWRGEREAVRTYNADEKLRTCPECGLVNPRGYCWNKAKDLPEEAEARLIW